ncbi:hypothetical protein CHS0354_015822 [Potamilus streckersoni]|uniref:ShKT domain-containing protein n=1 Tax=Potamilus streckersoni TaxID=2493646 RepID=A0AAE0VUM5_9BIVA|nr:hypothetical protein CHS0354_015822 [Potamilus streckersoni]
MLHRGGKALCVLSAILFPLFNNLAHEESLLKRVDTTNTPGQGATAVQDITSLEHRHQSSTTTPDAVTVPPQNVLTTTLPMNFTVGQCEDSSVVPCALLDQTLNICSTPTGPSAATCPKYCKFC